MAKIEENEVYAYMDELQLRGCYLSLLEIVDYALDAVRNDGVKVVHAPDVDNIEDARGK